jgi:site-specific recombinase XerD
MNKITDFAYYLTDFLTNYLIAGKGNSNNTVKSYSYTFLLLLKYMKEVKNKDADRISLEDINKDNILGFLDWLQVCRKCGNSTRNQRLVAITTFVKYLQYKCPRILFKSQEIASIPSKRCDEKVISYLTVDGIKLLLKQPNRITDQGLRDLCLLSLMYESAARVQEIIDLTPTSLRISDKPYVVILHGKGNKERIVPLSESISSLLNEYLKRFGLNRRENTTKPLFPNPQHNPLTRNGINNMLIKYVKMAKQENPGLIPNGLSCHSLRHSKAMGLLESGIELIHIRDFLGHKSVITTEIYARVNPKFIFEAVKSAYVEINLEVPVWVGNKVLLEKLRELTK